MAAWQDAALDVFHARPVAQRLTPRFLLEGQVFLLLRAGFQMVNILAVSLDHLVKIL